MIFVPSTLNANAGWIAQAAIQRRIRAKTGNRIVVRLSDDIQNTSLGDLINKTLTV
jgi:hypothetical protein